MEHDSEIVVAARRWIGTRYAHQGRRKGSAEERGGVDCLGLLIGVAQDLSITARDGKPLAEHDRAGYSRQPDGSNLRNVLGQLLIERSPEMPPAAGEICLFDYDGNPQHLGILGSACYDGVPVVLTLIHAYAPSRCVVEHRFDASWHRRLVAHYVVPPPPGPKIS